MRNGGVCYVVVCVMTLFLSTTARDFYMDSLIDCSHISAVSIMRNETVRVFAKSQTTSVSTQGSCSISFIAVDTVQVEEAKLRVDFRSFSVLDCSVTLQLSSDRNRMETVYTCGDSPSFYVTPERQLFIDLYKVNPTSTKYNFVLYIKQDNLQPLPEEPEPVDVLIIVVAIVGGIMCIGMIVFLVWVSVSNDLDKQRQRGVEDSITISCCGRGIVLCHAEIADEETDTDTRLEDSPD